MANTVTKTKVLDSKSKVIYHIYLASDGVAGELANEQIVDVSGLTPAPTHLSIVQVNANLEGFSAILKFDATADDEALSLNSGESKIDLRATGGYVDPKSTGFTGDVLLDTNGFTAATDTGFIELICKKKFA